MTNASFQRKIFFSLVFLVSVGNALLHAQVVINEFLSSNLSGIKDEDGDFSDWLELYNPTGSSVNLEGYILNDGPNPADGWVFPPVELAPRSHLLLFASGKDRKIYNDDYTSIQLSSDHEAVMYTGGNPELFILRDPANYLRNGTNVLAIQGYNVSSTSSDFSLIPFLTLGSGDYTSTSVKPFVDIENRNMHTHFKISNDGEKLYLFNTVSELIDSTLSLPLPADVSYGRSADGQGNWAYFSVPSPGTANLYPTTELKIDTVHFSVKAGLYLSPITVTLTSLSTEGVIRYTTNGSEPTLQSPAYSSPLTITGTTVLRAKFFRENILNNPVTTNTYYFRGSNRLPLLSLSTHPDNFYDYYEGILVEGPNAEPNDSHFGANYWQDWEKPVNLEFFDEKGIRHLSQGAGVKVYGNWSKAHPSKSLSLFARSRYGKGSFKYKLFHDRDNDSFESFIIRNAGNDWPYSYIRDGLASEIAKDMDMERLAYQPAAVYLNGEYYGILNMRE